MRSSSASNAPTLTIGNIVSLSVSMYKSHFKQNLRFAVNAAIWAGLSKISLLLLVLAVVAQFGAYLFSSIMEISPYSESLIQGFANPITTFGIFVICILVSALGSAIFQLRQAQISRSTYSILLNQPESQKQILASLDSKLWKIWRLGVRVGLANISINLSLNYASNAITREFAGSSTL